MFPELCDPSATSLQSLPLRAWQYDNARAVELLGQLAITEQEARIRIVRFDDAGANERETWLHQWIAPVASDRHTPFTLRTLARSLQAFDIVMVHADDADALAAFTRDALRMLENTLIIVCMSKASPADNARVLNAGADAVIDLAMGRDAAAAYIRSIARRSRMLHAV